jgi:hypothetical protein
VGVARPSCRRHPRCIRISLATLAGSGAVSEAGTLWMVALDIFVIAAMQAGYFVSDSPIPLF